MSRKDPSLPPLSAEEYGRLGAQKRWGPPRVVRLDDLNNEQRRIVLAMIAAAQEAARAEKSREL